MPKTNPSLWIVHRVDWTWHDRKLFQLIHSALIHEQVLPTHQFYQVFRMVTLTFLATGLPEWQATSTKITQRNKMDFIFSKLSDFSWNGVFYTQWSRVRLARVLQQRLTACLTEKWCKNAICGKKKLVTWSIGKQCKYFNVSIIIRNCEITWLDFTSYRVTRHRKAIISW